MSIVMEKLIIIYRINLVTSQTVVVAKDFPNLFLFMVTKLRPITFAQNIPKTCDSKIFSAGFIFMFTRLNDLTNNQVS